MRQLTHALRNDLTLPTTLLDLLADQSGLPADLQPLVAAAIDDLAAAAARVEQLAALLAEPP
jgi:hypothetical protein